MTNMVDLDTMKMRLVAKRVKHKIENPEPDMANDPALYLEQFGPVWSKPREICESILVNKYTQVKAANGVSKTHTATGLALWWMDTQGPDCKVITTANTFNQLKFAFWTRLRSNYNKVRHRFKNAPIHMTQFMPNKEQFPDWYCIGLNPQVEKDGAGGEESTALQGHHAESGKVLWIMEEAIGVPRGIFISADGSMRSNYARQVAIYNPTIAEGVVYEREESGMVSEAKGNLITITAQDLFDDPLYDTVLCHLHGLTTPEGVKEWIDEYGEDSPIVQARVYAKYPDQSEDAAISVAGCNHAKQRMAEIRDGVDKDDFYVEDHLGRIIRVMVSWDVAGEGADMNVLGLMLVCNTPEESDEEGEITQEYLHGVTYEILDEWRTKGKGEEAKEANMKRVRDHLLALQKEYCTKPPNVEEDDWEPPSLEIVYDAVGEGSNAGPGVRILLKAKDERAGKTPWAFVGFKAGRSAKKIDGKEEIEIANEISEAWLRSKYLLEDGIKGPLYCDMDDNTLNQLTTRQRIWAKVRKQPQVWSIESKDDYKDRKNKKSPDQADAFVMMVWMLSHRPRDVHGFFL